MAREPKIFTIWPLTEKKKKKKKPPQLPGRERGLRGRRILNRAEGGGLKGRSRCHGRHP